MTFWLHKDPQNLWSWTLETGSGRKIALGGKNYPSEELARADIESVRQIDRLTPVFDRH